MNRFLCSLLYCCLIFASRARAQDAQVLMIGETAERVLVAGGVQSFNLDLEKDQFVYGMVDQIEADVIIKAFGPDGKEIVSIDVSGTGPEAFQFTTAATGRHRIEISPFETSSGRYVIVVEGVEPVATTPEGRIDQFMTQYSGEDRPGATVAVYQNGQVTFTRSYGMADLAHSIPNSPETLFNIGSVSKQFAGIVFAMLAEEGRISLTDDVRKYIPEIPDFGPTVTLTHLLNHTSGYREVYGPLALEGRRVDGDILKRQDAIDVVVRQPELQFEPGSEHLYNSTGYVLLTEIIERITGESYPDWMQTHVFDPLGMNDTVIEREPGQVIPNYAVSYTTMEGGRYREDFASYNYYGATDVYTNVYDLAKWLRNFRTSELGGPGVMERMKHRSVLTNGDTLGYTLGVRLGKYRGQSVIQHGGSTGGYRAFLSYLPDLDAGVAVMSNTGAVNASAAARKLMDEFFAEHLDEVPAQTAAATTSSADESEDVESWSPTPEELSEYEGRYFSEEIEAFYTLHAVDGVMKLSHRRLGEIDLGFGEKGTMTGPWPLNELKFVRNENGMVDHILISGGRMRRVRFDLVE